MIQDYVSELLNHRSGFEAIEEQGFADYAD